MLSPTDTLTLVVLGITVLGATWTVMWQLAVAKSDIRQLKGRVGHLERGRGIIPFKTESDTEGETA